MSRRRLCAKERAAILIAFFDGRVRGGVGAFKLQGRGLVRAAAIAVAEHGAWGTYTLTARGLRVARQLLEHGRPGVAVRWGRHRLICLHNAEVRH